MDVIGEATRTCWAVRPGAAAAGDPRPAPRSGSSTGSGERAACLRLGRPGGRARAGAGRGTVGGTLVELLPRPAPPVNGRRRGIRPRAGAAERPAAWRSRPRPRSGPSATFCTVRHGGASCRGTPRRSRGCGAPWWGGCRQQPAGDAPGRRALSERASSTRRTRHQRRMACSAPGGLRALGWTAVAARARRRRARSWRSSTSAEAERHHHPTSRRSAWRAPASMRPRRRGELQRHDRRHRRPLRERRIGVQTAMTLDDHGTCRPDGTPWAFAFIGSLARMACRHADDPGPGHRRRGRQGHGSAGWRSATR